MHLAIHASSRAVGVEHDRRIVEHPLGPPLKHAPHEHDRMLPGGGGKPLGERPGHALGLGELSVVLRLAGILSSKQLLQADDRCPLRGRCRDARQRLADVGLAVARAGRLHKAETNNSGVGGRGQAGHGSHRMKDVREPSGPLPAERGRQTRSPPPAGRVEELPTIGDGSDRL